MSQVKAIIGLGNPGDNYAATRHNAGAWLVEILARQAGTELRPEKKFLGLYAKVLLDGQELHLLEPTTFMNRSGGAVAALCQFYKIAPGELLVAHDELDLPPGSARYKQGGGHGGHNGLRDIISALGDKAFGRLRIGIGHPGDSRQVTNYVLGRPGKAELEAIGAALDECLATLPLVVTGKWAQAMNRLHSFKP
ncbi:aminoacyl-tRNA hydrolase [Halomonas sp. MCCC 1A17488]|uniref:Peptidyl-tRNA hydrolase n=1 Tax=Billgrantia sulfidoxydans TaxID=2733484 RepID=A0ABX7W5U8_9GAMM|nr:MULTISPECIES: aminoacyl-tRNA hydrolase [Halomonas]MCE8014566.1 aminoacyl-tRNA hydrolase [Halomonas sp. MCCC 1A17488]MCG3237899.1 aminoacyl-tRNA hydrolase [Halomonas sp. MCCC 1A17488]QPP48313.1 aminoacyl-tRNA hydrolase [Halomonas sp. SS10-MC5]QTP55621.1 aminoacyl-tRNA hydrolase [Halomonas sulfidoxydans]